MNIQSEIFIEKLNRKEHAAFQELFAYFHKQLCFYAVKIVKDKQEAEDIVQSVFLTFWNAKTTEFSDLKAVRFYLYTSVQNFCLKYIRNQEIRERNYKNYGQEEEVEEEYFLCQQIRAEVVAEIFEAVNELPEKCKKIFTLFYLEGLEDKEIAEKLGISLNTIKTQKQRAKAFLRVRLGKLFVYTGFLFIGL